LLFKGRKPTSVEVPTEQPFFLSISRLLKKVDENKKLRDFKYLYTDIRYRNKSGLLSHPILPNARVDYAAFSFGKRKL